MLRIFIHYSRMDMFYCLLILAGTILGVSSSNKFVLELSDSFPEIRREGGYWLVKFYIPSCGHCKKLEPVWAHVVQALLKTHIMVRQVDCSRFPSVASEFGVISFPTIKLIKAEEDFTFHGDRTRENIINFAIRMSGPPVQDVTRSESISNIKNMNQLFFMYVGDKEGPLWETFYDVAKNMQANGFFYSANEEIAKQHVDIERLPAVFVHKENSHYFYSVEAGNDPEGIEHLNSSMHKWFQEERFETFPKITRGNIHDFIQTNKYIVLVVVEENKLQQVPSEMLEFRNTVESLIRQKRDKYHKNFQFGWTASPELANSIAMQVLPLPHLLVLNSTTYHHHIPEDEPTLMTPSALEAFLERICNQSVPAYGGNGLPVRFYRAYFEARTTLASMWHGNPVLTVVIFGLPLSFLSFILYSCCCADIMDADDEEDEDLIKKRE